jgi:chitinase
MTFDFNGPWENRVDFHSALRGNGENTVESRVQYFMNLGVPAEKLILGIGFHGRAYVTSGNGNIGDATKNDFGFQGPFVKENGYLGYNEICRMQKESSWDVRFDPEASEAIGKFRRDGSTHVVTYATPRSVANKVKFAMEKNLGGVWAWFVDTDDLRGECKRDLTTFADFSQATPTPRRERDFPLLRTINEAMEMLSSNGDISETDWRLGRKLK